jgi:hypothetical protein
VSLIDFGILRLAGNNSFSRKDRNAVFAGENRRQGISFYVFGISFLVDSRNVGG